MPQIISREAAHGSGLRRYYTGEPCKNGHLSERYVSNTACVECLTQKFKFRVNPYNRDLAPYHTTKLWVPRELSEAQRAKLDFYLQSCIMEFTKYAGLMTNDLQDAFIMQLEGMQQDLAKVQA